MLTRVEAEHDYSIIAMHIVAYATLVAELSHRSLKNFARSMMLLGDALNPWPYCPLRTRHSEFRAP